MRDLKHLIYFENLLQEANNDLVKQGRDDGRLALGYTCYFMPEVLLDLPGCFSVRLRAPRCTSPDMATYYMSARTCHYGRSLLERALEGGFNFLDAQLATETCTVTCRFQEHLQRMPGIINNERFKCEFADVPFKKTVNSIDHYEGSCRPTCWTFSGTTTAWIPPTRRCARPSRSTTSCAASCRPSGHTASWSSPPSPATSSTSSIW